MSDIIADAVNSAIEDATKRLADPHIVVSRVVVENDRRFLMIAHRGVTNPGIKEVEIPECVHPSIARVHIMESLIDYGWLVHDGDDPLYFSDACAFLWPSDGTKRLQAQCQAIDDAMADFEFTVH